MNRNNITVALNVDLDYIMGHLRYGHYEGKVTLTLEEFEMLKKNPKNAVETLDLLSYLDFVLDDYEIEATGAIENVEYKEVKYD